MPRKRVVRWKRENREEATLKCLYVVDQRAIDVGAAEADGIEEGLIDDEVFPVDQVFRQDLGMANVVERHEPAVD